MRNCMHLPGCAKFRPFCAASPPSNKNSPPHRSRWNDTSELSARPAFHITCGINAHHLAFKVPICSTRRTVLEGWSDDTPGTGNTGKHPEFPDVMHACTITRDEQQLRERARQNVTSASVGDGFNALSCRIVIAKRTHMHMKREPRRGEGEGGSRRNKRKKGGMSWSTSHRSVCRMNRRHTAYGER